MPTHMVRNGQQARRWLSSKTQTWSRVQQASGRPITAQSWYRAGHDTVVFVSFPAVVVLVDVAEVAVLVAVPVTVPVAVVAGTVGTKLCAFVRARSSSRMERRSAF